MKQTTKYVTVILALFFLAACASGGEEVEVDTDTVAETETATITSRQETAGMLQHNVYFYLHGEVTEEEKQEFEEGLRALVQIEGIYKAEIGIPGATEERDVTDHSFGYSIFTWFETIEDYNVYAVHPDHLEFIDEFNHLWADVKVYDSEIVE